MRSQAGSTGGGKPGAKRSPRQQATAYRDWNANARKPAPYGRYEDKSPRPKPATPQQRWKAAKKAAAKKKGSK